MHKPLGHVSDNAGALETEGLEQSREVAGNRLFVVATEGLAGIAKSTQIRRNHGMALRQKRDKFTPCIGRLGPPVQQDHWAALPGRSGMDA